MIPNTYTETLSEIKIYISSIYNDLLSENIGKFLRWFLDSLKIHFSRKIIIRQYKKWDILLIDLGQNIWSEICKRRPCVVFSEKKYNHTDSLVVIPLKSYKNKSVSKFEIMIKADKDNLLYKNSLVSFISIREISKKRIIKHLWRFNAYDMNNISNKFLDFFGYKK